MIMYLLIKVFKKTEKTSSKKIILVDKFFTYKKKQNLNYFPNFAKNKNVRIVPTIIPTFNFFKLIKILSSLIKNDEKIIFKEEYLKFEDLLFAFGHYFRRNKFIKSNYIYKSINVSKLVNEEISSYNDFYSINNGLLNYRFFERLSKNNVNIFKSFNWFENQIIDKGWNLGFRKFYNNNQKHSYGYQDFNKHFNLISNSPSKLEVSSKVTPNQIIIISNYFKGITKEFSKNLKLVVGQSERFKNLNKVKTIPWRKRIKILFVLCGIREIDVELLKIAVKTCERKRNLKIFIKSHPILEINDIYKEKLLPSNLIPINGDLNNILKETLVSITAGPSSALLESSSCGVYNILPEIECGTEENLKIFNLNKNGYSLIRNSNDLIKTINYIFKNKKRIKIKKIKKINLKSKNIGYFFN